MEYETNQGVGKLSEEVGLFFGRFPESTEKCNVLRSTDRHSVYFKYA